MTQPAKGHEPSMEEILASIRRIIADEPGSNVRNEAVGDEAARERSWRNESPRSESVRRENPRSEGLRLDAPRTVIPRGDDARRESTRDNPASEGLPHASPIGSMELREEACLPRSDVRTQPFGRNAAPALSAVPKGTPESPPSGPSGQEGFSSSQPATAQEEIEQIMAMLHTGPRAVSAVGDEDADDIVEFSEQQRAAAEALPAAEFAAPDAHVEVLYEEEREEEADEREAQQPEQHEQEVAAQAAEVESAGEPEPMPVVKAAVREPYRPDYEQVRLPVREQTIVPAPEHVRGSDRDRGPGVAAEQRLVSAATSAAVDSAFNTLAQTVLVQNGRTLEDLVREMLRPMLKTWLDDNLPSLVERLVRAEIDRVSRGRG
jgi:cell pole-organizing protein PopZ